MSLALKDKSKKRYTKYAILTHWTDSPVNLPSVPKPDLKVWTEDGILHDVGTRPIQEQKTVGLHPPRKTSSWQQKRFLNLLSASRLTYGERPFSVREGDVVKLFFWVSFYYIFKKSNTFLFKSKAFLFFFWQVSYISNAFLFESNKFLFFMTKILRNQKLFFLNQISFFLLWQDF